MTQQIPISRSRQTLPCFCFFVLFFFLKRSYWSKFHVNIITSSRVMAIFLYKGLTRNLEIGSTPIGILSNIWRKGKLEKPNLSRMSLMKCYWMLQNARFTAFTVSELLKGKLAGVGKITPCAFHFVEIQSAFYPYIQSRLDVFK